MSSKPDRIQTYAEFWPFYLREHSKPLTKKFHLFGTILVVAVAIYAVATRCWASLWLAPLCGYGFAWYSHFFIEKNRPATFKYPFWSLISDFRMAWWMVTGRLK